MAEISKITLPSGTTYDIKDSLAREMASGVIHLITGVNTTPLTDGASTNPIVIDGQSYTAAKGDATFYQNKEFVYDGATWHEFGDLTSLKALAYKDTASASYTPEGIVSQPTFSGTITASENENGNYLPTGTVSQPTYSGTITTSESESGNYLPKGVVSTPTISVKTAGTTTTVNSITDVGALPSLSTTVENENLTITFNQGTLPTKGADTTVKTGDAAYQSTQPVFTGTKAQLDVSGTVTQPTFTGDKAQLNVSGTVTQPTFTGKTATITVS